MRARMITTTLLLAGLGCGDRTDASAAATQALRVGGEGRAAATGNGDLSAEEVARARRGAIRCPARSPARSTGTPADDVLGVRAGMPMDEAITHMLCSHPLMIVHYDSTSNRFNLQTFGVPVVQSVTGSHAKAQVTRSSKQIMADLQQSAMDRGNNRVRRDVAPGESAWLIGTMGLPGEERVTDVAREEWFEEGQEPAMSVLEEALIAKYGTPTMVQHNNGNHILRWSWLADGTRLGERDASRCSGSAYRTAALSFLEECGTLVEAIIDGQRDNPAIARTLHIRSMHHANAVALIERTSSALQNREATRRREQVEQAKKRGAGPVL